MIREWAPGGLHQFVADSVVAKFAGPGIKAIDLGTGGGAMADRLQKFGCDVTDADVSTDGYEATVAHIVIDLNRTDFASALGINSYKLITAIEVIEHLENPISFLRNLGHMLAPGGVAVITTPNVDSLLARLKFFLTGRIRFMDEQSEPTHISPVFFDLFRRQYLPLSGLRVSQHLVYPPNGFQSSRQSVRKLMNVAARCFSGESIRGDHHVLLLQVDGSLKS
jgi:SAM-dependent methyltransferase